MKGINMKFDKNEKVILTDVDGVLLNWEWAFKGWLAEHYRFRYGKELVQVDSDSYDMGVRYGITDEQCKEYVTMFNNQLLLDSCLLNEMQCIMLICFIASTATHFKL